MRTKKILQNFCLSMVPSLWSSICFSNMTYLELWYKVLCTTNTEFNYSSLFASLSLHTTVLKKLYQKVTQLKEDSVAGFTLRCGRGNWLHLQVGLSVWIVVVNVHISYRHDSCARKQRRLPSAIGPKWVAVSVCSIALVTIYNRYTGF